MKIVILAALLALVSEVVGHLLLRYLNSKRLELKWWAISRPPARRVPGGMNRTSPDHDLLYVGLSDGSAFFALNRIDDGSWWKAVDGQKIESNSLDSKLDGYRRLILLGAGYAPALKLDQLPEEWRPKQDEKQQHAQAN